MEVDQINANAAVQLKSSDNKVFNTTLKCVQMSGTLKEMLEHVGVESIENIGVIPLQNVDSVTLEQVLSWTDHHKHTPQPTSEEIKDKTADSIDPWDEKFLEMDIDKLYNLITAANYLNIPQLLWLTTRKIAMMIKNKSPHEIRTIFNIENDWSPQELENVQKENQWCEEK